MLGLALVLLLAPAQDPPPPDFELRAKTLSSRLEELRGLRLKTPLTLRPGTRKEYAQYVLANARRVYGGDLAPAGEALKVLGLIPAKLRLDLALTAQAGFGTKVFAQGTELCLLDAAAGDEWILNKMDLALVDQHFAPVAAETYDAQMALAALRMGDAEVVKHLIWGAGRLPEDAARKSAADAAAWERGESRLASAIAPRLFVRTGDFAWRRGAAFALEIFTRGGGLRALDDAWARPPASTEQVLHPGKYFTDERPALLDLTPLETFLKPQGCSSAWASTLGELGLALVLETHFPGEDLTKVSEGWAGDALTLFTSAGAAPLLAWATEWDTEEDAVEFQAQAFRLLRKLTLPESDVAATAVRRGTSVFFAAGVPKGREDALLDAAWTCRRTRNGRRDTYGE